MVIVNFSTVQFCTFSFLQNFLILISPKCSFALSLFYKAFYSWFFQSSVLHFHFFTKLSNFDFVKVQFCTFTFSQNFLILISPNFSFALSLFYKAFYSWFFQSSVLHFHFFTKLSNFDFVKVQFCTFTFSQNFLILISPKFSFALSLFYKAFKK